MEKPYGEGLASHTDPESCVVSREAGREVLIGAQAQPGQARVQGRSSFFGHGPESSRWET